MIEPINVAREEFPHSERVAEGMRVLTPQCDRHEMYYVRDVVYAKRGETELHLQLLLPRKCAAPTPMIVFIPGSAFRRQDVAGCVPGLAVFAHAGYGVAVLQYRGSEEASFPSVVVDAKAGLVFLKEHAAEYHIDADKLFLMGDSSGGYTALMAALTRGIADLEDEYSKGKDYGVQGVIDYYGPTDFTTMNEALSTQNHMEPDSPEGLFIGGKWVDAQSELVQKTIIKNYVTDGRKLPPILMFHGSADELVPFEQSCELYEALREQGHEVTFYQIKGAHHGGPEFWSTEVLALVTEFILS